VIHSADATGRAVETTLLDKAKAHPNISLFPYHIGIDLITAHKHLATEENSCLGCYVLDIKKDQPKRRKSFRARHKCDTNPPDKLTPRYWSCKKW